MGRDTVQLETAVNTVSHEYLLEFTSEYGIPETLYPELPGPEDKIVDFPEGKVGVYTRFFEFANFRFPLSQFLFDVLGEVALKVLYKRLFVLETCKSISVPEELRHPSLVHSFRRLPRGGIEQEQLGLICSRVAEVTLSNMYDRWSWTLEASSEFTVKSTRILTDDKILPKVEVPTSPRLSCGIRSGEEKSPVSQDQGGPAFDAALQEYCDKNYNQLLPIMAEKFNEEKERNEKLKGVKARLNFGGSSGTSRYSESRTMSTREHEKRHRSRRSRSPRPSPSVFSRIRRERSRSPKQNLKEKEGDVFKRLGEERVCSHAQIVATSAPIRDIRKRNARVWFDDLPPESIDSYDDLKKAFLENYLQQKKYIKDLIELHNIKQRDGESMDDFVKRYKLENRDVNGAPECMRISGFVHGITNPELIKRLH
nr:reverse transcriptase domain-containing protein [Tanacetum cinerariifolium]